LQRFITHVTTVMWLHVNKALK